MTRRLFALLAAGALAACGKGDTAETATADSLQRDLQLAPADSAVALADTPAAPPAPAPAAPAPAPAPKPAAAAPKPAAPKPAAPKPAAPAARVLAAGSTFAIASDVEITSKTNKAGESFTATVGADVTNDKGEVVIPAGSKVTLVIAEIRPSERKSDPGKLALTVRDVTIGGKTTAIVARVTEMETKRVGRAVAASDVGKGAAGAGAGAVVGGIVGGKTGAIVGGVIGGAVGTQRAVETADRDIVLPAGGKVTIEVTDAFTA